jgi:hypothetical protein
VAGGWSLVSGPWFLVVGYWFLGPGLWSLATGLWSLAAGPKPLVIDLDHADADYLFLEISLSMDFMKLFNFCSVIL